MASKGRFVVGSHVWVEDPDEAWTDGLVDEINADELVINCTSGKKVTTNVSGAYPKDTESPLAGVEDMTRLAYLHEPGVLQNLKSRYSLNEIYSNPVLEAFGNAKTVRNNNSSRFGKFVEIQFDEDGKISGAAIRTYLLERSQGSEADSSVPKDEKSQFHLRTAAELFMCDEKGLEESLCKRVMATRGESITKNLDPRAAALSRDALARIVYSRLFDWLVNKINSSIGQDPDSKILIGVLDIYGFESFLTNSFEQFCINLTNEKLQQHFNQHVFKMEQEEYTKEEIDWSYIQFVDNQEILDLIEKQQLQSLLETLSATEPHYIRCIKPNNVLKPAIFENSDVLQQLRCGGVLEAIRISCLGYPTRRAFSEFVNRFGILQPKVLDRSHNEVAAAKVLLEKANLTGYQSRCRCYLAHSQYVRLIKATIIAQCAWRGRVARRELQNLKMAAKETGALQAAKSKLEKEVEELTWQLELEKRTKEATKEASEKVVVPKILADTTFDNDLTAENERLKEQLASFEAKLHETEQKLEKIEKARERLLDSTDAESKINELKNTIQRFNLANGSLHAEEQGFRASNITVDMDLVRQVEAKYPALLFKQQLTAFVEGLYGMIRDNVKKEISSALSLVIQVPTIFARKIFTQIFSSINAQLLNSNGEYVKQGLEELEAWCTQAKPEYAGSAWDELKHICQAVGFLVIFKKFRISYDEIINDLCPVLSVQQIYKICTEYLDDKYNTESVSEEVLDEMKKSMNAGSGQGSSDNGLLLDEEISMPLSLEEIANSMDAKEFQNVNPPQELVENASFQFLKS
ncbi:hypothetical protein PR202_gb29606 [Eleusine coracana subsp. coracana]|uniref:Uncharacterized protein n=1 Tax=Eleusine coracana subsp. coracana TaxID=191504 RepID=A0AAV5FZV1_ELECO|nr:hypothetical protein PR202_gb29606 [Eleusine coracana subsp. coracana]